MSRGRKKSIFRADASRAFLRFLIGEVLLFTLCALFYIFVLQGEINIELPISQPQQQEPTQVPDEALVTEMATSEAAETLTPIPTEEPTPVPTIEPTAEPTATPTPEPTATPIPDAELAGTMEEIMGNLPELASDQLKLGLKELSVVNSTNQSVLIVRGYAYIEGADAANSHGYIILNDAASGEMLGMYPVTPKAEDADLAFEEASGTNLDQAFFQLNVDVDELYDGIYLVSMAVENNGKVVWNYFDDSTFHFFITEGVAVPGQ